MALFLDITDVTRADALLELLRAHWPVWATAGLGAVGIYGLLPRVSRSTPIWAGLAAATAVVLAGIWLIRYQGAAPEKLLFYSFSALAILGALFMLSQKNPVHAALAFALVVLSVCGLFLLLAAPFLMAATIIIYAGAIVVTFLFVIMLAQQSGLTDADARAREPFLASLTSFVLLGSLWCVLDQTYNIDPVLRQLDQVAQARSFDEVAKIWGSPDAKAGAKTLPAVEHLKKALPSELEDLVLNLDPAWAKKDLAALTKAASRLRDQAVKLQLGALKNPDPKAPTEPPVTAHNVAGLGRAIFTRYLIPVEIAGVLLLVATIGAIIIAGRRKEKQR